MVSEEMRLLPTLRFKQHVLTIFLAIGVKLIILERILSIKVVSQLLYDFFLLGIYHACSFILCSL